MMSAFKEELIDEEGTLFGVIQAAMVEDGIAINHVIEQEWRNTCGTELFLAWLEDGLHHGYISYIDGKLDSAVQKKIRTDFGFPSSRDIHYLRVANETTTRYIITFDIDFHDPTEKDSGPERRCKIILNRSGALCRYLMKTLNLVLGVPEQAAEELGYGPS